MSPQEEMAFLHIMYVTRSILHGSTLSFESCKIEGQVSSQ